MARNRSTQTFTVKLDVRLTRAQRAYLDTCADRFEAATGLRISAGEIVRRMIDTHLIDEADYASDTISARLERANELYGHDSCVVVVTTEAVLARQMSAAEREARNLAERESHQLAAEMRAGRMLPAGEG